MHWLNSVPARFSLLMEECLSDFQCMSPSESNGIYSMKRKWLCHSFKQVHLVEISIHPIGIIKTSFESGMSVPIQSSKSHIIGEVLIDEEFVDGLESLALFSHVILLYWFHRASPPKLKVVPYLDKRERGLFSTRSPSRPNPVGISIVELLKIEDNRIVFKGADMLDGSPLIDIKPFIPEFDCRPDANSGWLREFLDQERQSFLSDSRFQDQSNQ